jgi:putative endonuclease
MQSLAKKIVRKFTLSRPATRIYDRFNPTTSLGQKGERVAERLLLAKNYVIIARGFQDKFGEIDLIAVDNETIVFVEVKTRTSDLDGDPAEAVDTVKQTRITKTAIGYLKWHRLIDCPARFDVVAITWPDQTQDPNINHYENAFEPVRNSQLI